MNKPTMNQTTPTVPEPRPATLAEFDKAARELKRLMESFEQKQDHDDPNRAAS